MLSALGTAPMFVESFQSAALHSPVPQTGSHIAPPRPGGATATTMMGIEGMKYGYEYELQRFALIVRVRIRIRTRSVCVCQVELVLKH
eukprot:scaffold189215_cov15-Prasinocladus_malaysianus.AAC.1